MARRGTIGFDADVLVLVVCCDVASVGDVLVLVCVVCDEAVPCPVTVEPALPQAASRKARARTNRQGVHTTRIDCLCINHLRIDVFL